MRADRALPGAITQGEGGKIKRGAVLQAGGNMARSLRTQLKQKRPKAGKNKNKQLHFERAGSGDAIPAVVNLKLRLSSPNECSPRTLNDYLPSATRFMRWLGHDGPPTENELRLYFVHRREDGIQNRTLRKEFYHLKVLCEANHWAWPFGKRDVPRYVKKERPPAQPIPEIEQMIRSRDRLSKMEVFYLAVSTTWGCRRIELSTIKKRDYDDHTFLLHIGKNHPAKRHLIPECLKPVFQEVHPKPQTETALSYVYHSICRKTGIEQRSGWGWHNIRRAVDTVVKYHLIKNDLPQEWIADWMAWTPEEKGREFTSSAMAGHYDHPEILNDDPWYQEKMTIKIHPFLALWCDLTPAAKVSGK
jgi:hypothetical protein